MAGPACPKGPVFRSRGAVLPEDGQTFAVQVPSVLQRSLPCGYCFTVPSSGVGDITLPAILANSPLAPNKLRFGSTALAEDQPVGQGGKAGEGLRFSQPLALVEDSGLGVGVGGRGRTEALKRLINFRVIGRSKERRSKDQSALIHTS